MQDEDPITSTKIKLNKNAFPISFFLVIKKYNAISRLRKDCILKNSTKPTKRIQEAQKNPVFTSFVFELKYDIENIIVYTDNTIRLIPVIFFKLLIINHFNC